MPRPLHLLSEAQYSFVVTNKIPPSSDISQGCYEDTKCLQRYQKHNAVVLSRHYPNQSKEMSVFHTDHYVPTCGRHLWGSEICANTHRLVDCVIR
jgi:hypothetical protein